MRLDGPHRVFVVLAGLWATYGLLFVSDPYRLAALWSWPSGRALMSAFPDGEVSRAVLFLALPIVSLYGVGWAGRKVMAWVADGFDQRANSGFSEPGRHQ